LVVVVDEFAGLAVQQPDFIHSLLGVAQRGRSLGVHLLLATQRPSGVISDDIRANTNLRIALRVQDPADSTDVVGDAAAAYLPRSTPGRAVMRLGSDELIDFQAATCTGRRAHRSSSAGLAVRTFDSLSARGDLLDVEADVSADASDLDLLVDAIRNAARSAGIAMPHRPWLDPLSAEMGVDALPAEERGGTPRCDARGDPIVGIVDDPDHQTRRPLTWPAQSGHLLLVGAPGSGTTTALLELAATLESSELFVIDVNGDQRWDVIGDCSSCASLVRIHEGERLLRLLDHLCNVIDTRRASPEPTGTGGGRGAGTVVMIDGLAALRTELTQAERWQQLDQLERIVAEGVTAGIRVAIAIERPGAVPSAMLGQIARRWVFHLADSFDAGVLGVAAAAVPAPVPGRLFDTAVSAEAQIISGLWANLEARRLCDGGSGRRDLRLGELASAIDVSTLSAAVAEGGDVLAPIGIAFDDLRPAVLPIAAGEHVLVVGPTRSGRTTLLNTIADRWSTAHENGWIGNVARRRSSAHPGSSHPDVAALFAAMPHGRPALIVIDDAELVDDPTGVLATHVGNRADNVTVVAAGRGDGLRSTYGHWSAAVRRSRLGLVMAASNELDGDLLGATLPRRLPIPSRPGLAWLIADGDRRLMQVAVAHASVEVGAFPA
jgi:DNA segregation ATPase FtsK/SpoIIIE, S-DNA-T family